MNIYNKTSIAIFLLFGLLSSAEAKLVFTAPPRETAQAGEKFYGPIADALSQYLDKPVSYFHPKNWSEYSRDMRNDKFDLVFDGPQFASWRMVHIGHVPLASLDGKLRFVIVAASKRKYIRGLQDILGKKLCGLASPNLGTLAAFNLFKDPIIQPSMKNVKGGMRAVLEQFNQGKCDAAILRQDFYKRIPADKRKKMKIIAQSRAMPNQSFTVSKHVDYETRNKLKLFFLSPSGAQAANNLLERFSKKKKYFVNAEAKDFSGLNELLEGVVFGW